MSYPYLSDRDSKYPIMSYLVFKFCVSCTFFFICLNQNQCLMKRGKKQHNVVILRGNKKVMNYYYLLPEQSTITY